MWCSHKHPTERRKGATHVPANSISDHIISTVEPNNFECLFVTVIFHANKQLTIGNIYRPPSAPADSTMCTGNKMNELFLGTSTVTGLIVLPKKIEACLIVYISHSS